MYEQELDDSGSDAGLGSPSEVNSTLERTERIETRGESFVKSRKGRGGPRSRPSEYYSPSIITSTYTWNPVDTNWTYDSIAIGTTSKASRELEQAIASEGPESVRFLDRVVRHTVLEGCEGPPNTLMGLVQEYLGRNLDFNFTSISSPLPIYHKSGASKDVYLMMMLLLNQRVHSLEELHAACKISRSSSSITEDEVKFHRRLYETGGGDSTYISRLIYSFDLNDYPELNLPDRRLTIERFVPGQTAGYFMDGPHHLDAALHVSRCAFNLLLLSHQAFNDGRNIRATNPNLEPPVELLGASFRFPADINPGNFIITKGITATFVDPGELHPRHTFSQIMLRLIDNYWKYSLGKKGQQDVVLPLAPLFKLVRSHFGNEVGTKLLEEFRVNIGFLIGTPIADLRARFPGQPVDQIGDKLIRDYGLSDSKAYLSTYIRFNRPVFRGKYFAEVDSAMDSDFVSQYYRPKALPYFFSDRQLHSIASQLDKFLGLSLRESKHQKFLTRGSVQALKGKPFTARLDMPFGLFSRNMVSSAVLFTPFPDPNLVRIGMTTVNSLSTGKLDSDEGFTQYISSISSAASILFNLFDDRQFSREVWKIYTDNSSDAGIDFVDAERSTARHTRVNAEKVKKWLDLLIALREVYHFEGNTFPEVMKDSNKWKALIAELNKPDPCNALELVLRIFPEITSVPESSTFICIDDLPNGKETVRNLVHALEGKKISKDMIALPKLDFPDDQVTH